MAEAQTYHAAANRRLAAFALVTVVAAALAWAWRRWRPFRVAVEGDSMRPALEAGDRLVATRRGALRMGSIVVVEHPERPGFELVKRIHGLPGDPVDGRVLGPDELWVLGDDPDVSTDSRSFGPVPGARIQGVARLRYGPLRRARLLSAGSAVHGVGSATPAGR
jgi:nickel-type superoxide dismutase maturation protease